jgi:hypothetical protein
MINMQNNSFEDIKICVFVALYHGFYILDY